MRGWSAPLEEPLLRWNQQDWGRGVGREDRNDGAHTRCSSGAFASALHVLCASPWLAFPPLPVYGILCHFFSALISSPAEGGRRLPPSGGVTASAANPGAAGRAREHPVAASSVPTPLWRTAPAPLVVSPSNSPPPLQPCKVQMELTPGAVVSSPLSHHRWGN